jgi:uncharacterized protein (DUF488 family)
MKQLYDFGYIGSKLPDLKKAAEALNAIVVDIRFSARSRNPVWNSGNLRYVLDNRYYHERGLGNVNYRIPGMENVKFADLEKGLENIGKIMDKGFSVIVMCACKDRERCHRLLVVQEFEKRHGVKSTPIGPADLLDLAGIKVEKQGQLL